jgi:methionyl-tRNA formyltransferase
MDNPLRIVFFGSPEAAVPSLRALAADNRFTVAAVVTQPDRPAGRGRRLTPPPVKTAAMEAGLWVRQPETLRGRRFRESMENLKPDFLAVVAFGRIFGSKLLAVPRFGCVNLHFSLLPRYRGAAPVNWALIRGESVTGVTTMIMDEELDSGPILLQQASPVEPWDTSETLSRRLAEAGAPLLVLSLVELSEGRITPAQQDHSQASFAPMLNKEDGLVDWNMTAVEIFNRWRGLQPWPGIFTTFRGEQLKLIKVGVAPPGVAARPIGTLVIEDDRLFIACRGGTLLEVFTLQLPGKRPVDAIDFLHGYRPVQKEKLK